ncbi:PIR Superfamily Protein [Plasmodium ovale wallikeri]|uniref:PIR Superfamily Protein n=1 Tax=Plasmodium ovale wallikeri TaxID=864142 RepID=A0A1A9AMT8_PLAOA|nr:PIR Superfamily Protein [Plasmodium ovale wallikeri]SBT57595.1 PIR Superfamily Protein [Plasmodium ovale wallikeri]
MSAGKNDYTLDMFVKQDSTLKNSLLYKLYQNFEKASCDSTDSTEYCADNFYESLDSSVTDLYKKLQINLKTISNNYHQYFLENPSDIEEDITKEKVCIYLKYWLFDQAISKKIENEHITNFFNVWEKERKQKCPECTCKLYTMNMPTVKHVKMFYDYFLFYDKNKDTITTKNTIESSPYCKYLTQSYIIYQLKKSTCPTTNNKSPDCKEFSEYISKYIDFDDKLSEIICSDEERSADYYDHSGYKDLTLPETIWRAEESEEPVKPEEGDSVTIEESVILPEEQENETPVIISVTLLSILLTLYIFYEFTPFRYLVHVTIKRLKSFWKNEARNSNNASSYTPEDEYMNSVYEEYTIPYHSLENS